MIAELNGKISSSASNLSDRLEDQLTGDFFGSLRYISFDKVMKKILKRTTIIGKSKEDIFNIISSIDTNYWSDNITFWPYSLKAELDLILEFEEIVIGIEVKLHSGLSSDDDIDYILEDKKEQSINQLARESEVLKEKTSISKKSALLILVAPEDRSKTICEDVSNRGIIEEGVKLGYLSWEEILEGIKQLSLSNELDEYEKLIINDIILLLKRKGLERFKKINFECEDIDAKLFFDFQEKRHEILEFNYNEIIERESYYEFR